MTLIVMNVMRDDDSDHLLSLPTALKIHVSPTTQKMLAENYPSFILELRGEVDMKV